MLDIVRSLQGCGKALLFMTGASKSIDQDREKTEKRDDAADVGDGDAKRVAENVDISREESFSMGYMQVRQKVSKIIGGTNECRDRVRKEQQLGIHHAGTPSPDKVGEEQELKGRGEDEVDSICPDRGQLPDNESEGAELCAKYQ